MSQLASYLSARSQRKVLELLETHVGRCKAVGRTLSKIGGEWYRGETEAVKISKEIIHTEEKSADNIEQELILEVVKSKAPDSKLKEDFIKFVKMVDTSAGGAKRAATNMLLLIKYPLPEKYAKIVNNSTSLIVEIFDKIETAILNIENTQRVIGIALEIDKLENKMDNYYQELKVGYFEIEKSFESAAALIILDHIVRDLEYSVDSAEDAMDILRELVQKRN